jgi:hypothetical protein
MLSLVLAATLAAAPAPRAASSATTVVHIPRLDKLSGLQAFMSRAGTHAGLARPSTWAAEFHPFLALDPDDVGRQVGDAAEKARLQAHLAASEAKSSWPGLEAAVEHVLGDIKNEIKKSADAIDPDKTASDINEKLSALKKRLFG